jgi:hypothetical protein
MLQHITQRDSTPPATTTTVYQHLTDANNFLYNTDSFYVNKTNTILYQTLSTSIEEHLIKANNNDNNSNLDVNDDKIDLIRLNLDVVQHHKICMSWQKLTLVVLFCLLIVITIIGNTLVILSVATTRRLRTVTNCFVMSLAVADWLVGIFVMPPAVFLFIVGKCFSV